MGGDGGRWVLERCRGGEFQDDGLKAAVLCLLQARLAEDRGPAERPFENELAVIEVGDVTECRLRHRRQGETLRDLGSAETDSAETGANAKATADTHWPMYWTSIQQREELVVFVFWAAAP